MIRQKEASNLKETISLFILALLIPTYIEISNQVVIWISTATLVISHISLTYFFVCIFWIIHFILNSNYRESAIGKFRNQKSFIVKFLIIGVFSFGIPILLMTYALSSIQPYILSLFSPFVILFVQILEVKTWKQSQKIKLHFLTQLIFWIGYLILILSTDFWRIVISSFTMKHFLLVLSMILSISFGYEMTNQLFLSNSQDEILLPTLLQLIGAMVFSVLFCFVKLNFSFFVFITEISRIPISILLLLVLIGPLLLSLIFTLSMNLINTFPLKFLSFICFPVCAFGVIVFMIVDSYDVNNFINFSFFASLAIILNTISMTSSTKAQEHIPQRLLL